MQKTMRHEIPEHIIYANCMGPNPIKLLEWNLENLNIPSGSKILDLGSGLGLTSVYLANKFDAEVIALDKGVSPDKVLATMQQCKPHQKMPLPLKGDARDLPFPSNFFDFVIATDSFIYFGTDDLYIPYISRFIKKDGYLCFTVPGFNQDVSGAAELPDHLKPFWSDECWTWHTQAWWQHHLIRTGYLQVLECESMINSYLFWKEEALKGPLDWRDNDLSVIEQDQGQYMGFIKVVAQRKN